MIVSASRRTDVPALYPEWLRQRVEQGYADVVSPFDARRVRRVGLQPAAEGGDLEALVLWTRDPAPLLPGLPAWEARGLRTLWLVTVTGYPAGLEPRAPRLEPAVAALRELAREVGPDRVVWRYDPVLLCPSAGLGADWHRANFAALSAALAGTTRRCVVSLYDDYAKTRRRLSEAGFAPQFPDAETEALVGDLADTARRHAIEVRSCCEALSGVGVAPGACIDGEILAELWGIPERGIDPGQRPGCRCARSVDVGAYDTCVHGCLYCYATGSARRAAARRAAHAPRGERLA